MALIPKYNIAFKDESIFMKIIGKILFFNPSFMIDFNTTIGNTIYFPSRQHIIDNPVTFKANLVHELIHRKDAESYSSFIFSLAYLLPQLLAPLTVLSTMFLSWWISLIIFTLFLMPLPAYFRMKFEKKAYTFSVYCLYQLSTKYGHQLNVDDRITSYTKAFTSSNYYFMWIFFDQDYLKNCLTMFANGQKPYYSAQYYEMADTMLDGLENSSIKI